MNRPAILLLVVGVLTSGCRLWNNNEAAGSSTGTPTSPSAPPAPPSVTAADLAFCVQDTNRFRAMQNRAALTESAALEAFAALGAQQDLASGIAHQHFTSTLGGGGVARTENEYTGAFATAQSWQALMRDGLTLMWSEGPGGGHYENILGPFMQVGCGVAFANGQMMITWDFR